MYALQRRAMFARGVDDHFFAYGGGVDAEFDEGGLFSWDEPSWDRWLERVRLTGTVEAAVEGGIPSRSGDGWYAFLSRARSAEYQRRPLSAKQMPPPDPVLIETQYERERRARWQAQREESDRQWKAELRRRAKAREAKRAAEYTEQDAAAAALAAKNRAIVDEMARQQAEEYQKQRAWRRQDQAARIAYLRQVYAQAGPGEDEERRIEYEAAEASRLAARCWADPHVMSDQWHRLANQWVEALPAEWRERALRLVHAKQGFQLGTMWERIARGWGVTVETQLEKWG